MPDGERQKCYNDLGLSVVRSETLSIDPTKAYCRISDTHVVIQDKCDGNACGVVQRCNYGMTVRAFRSKNEQS